MNNQLENSRFILERYSGPKSRYTCPACGKPRQFTRYLDANTGEYLADYVGICNRANKCGYHYPPATYYREHPTPNNTQQRTPNTQQGVATKRFTNHEKVLPPVETPDFIPNELFQKSLSSVYHQHNHFITYLIKHCGYSLTLSACKRFHIGTAKRWPGATLFWQIDQQNRVRTGKTMLYNPETGKRVKLSSDRITWAHTQLKGLSKDVQGDATRKTFNLSQCLFGLHQLIGQHPTTVVVVEAEKTAVVGSIYLPQYTWMACGGLKSLTLRILQPIKHCPIILYPDIKAFKEWDTKASLLKKEGFRIQVSTLLETLPGIAGDKRFDGFDLADFLLEQPPPKSPLDQMIDKNPSLLQLVERFDLVPVNA